MNKLIVPESLKPGDRVALIAPSGPLPEGRLEKAVRAVENMGLVPAVYPSVRSWHGYLAGGDELRAADVGNAFADPTVRGVLCARGGYGAQRLHKLIDWEAVRRNPKVFLGYSDVTYLHAMMNQWFVTYHAPMPSTEWYHGLDDYTARWVRTALFGGTWGELPNCAGKARHTVAPGRAAGRLVGGNLSLVSSALGTPYALDARDAILFLEDVGEQPYRIDGMLNHLVQSGALDGCRGVILGYFTDCAAEKPAESLTLRQVFDELLGKLGIPVLSGVTCGHEEPTLSLPLGRMCELDADKQTIRIMEEN